MIELEYILGYKEESDNSKRMLFRKIINEYHKYKKYSDYVGRTINYFVKKDGEIIGCVGVASGVLALKHRDDFIGWDREHRLKNLKRKFGDRLVLLETMVQPPFTGTVYKASGWKMVGKTKGTSFKSRPSKSLLLKGSKKRASLVKEGKYEEGNYKYCGKSQYGEMKKVVPKYIFVKPIYKNWKDILNTL
jgi:hypothetical protein